MKTQRITNVITIHEGAMNVWTKFNGNPSNSCGDKSVWTIMLSIYRVGSSNYAFKSHWFYFGDTSRINNNVNIMKMAPADSVSGNAISSMGISAPPPVENTPVPASQPSPRIYQERVHVSVNTLPEFNSVSALYFFTVSPYASVRLSISWIEEVVDCISGGDT